ncbi:MAG: ADP-ribosylglycohydrolase family protein [Cytophagaceae bacterium]|nr:ADP-ribosylglycohydrolase family protein [Cytophagaceae bacterium]
MGSGYQLPDGVFAPFQYRCYPKFCLCGFGFTLWQWRLFPNYGNHYPNRGQDADCNPSSAGGILGAVLGYSKIPEYWKLGLKEIEDIDFKYTTISLNDVYEIGFKHALQNIERNGGKISGEKVTIALQAPVPVKMEKSFSGIYPIDKIYASSSLKDEYSFDFEGTGFVIKGEPAKWASESK